MTKLMYTIIFTSCDSLRNPNLNFIVFQEITFTLALAVAMGIKTFSF